MLHVIKMLLFINEYLNVYYNINLIDNKNHKNIYYILNSQLKNKFPHFKILIDRAENRYLPIFYFIFNELLIYSVLYCIFTI